MVFKQKSIFDEEPVKVRPQKEQTKTEDDFIPLEESIFALTKKGKVIVHTEPTVVKDDFVSIEDTIFCQRSIYHEDNDEDNEDTILLSHDDEVPLEESIFARHKKRTVTVSGVIYKDNKVDLEELFKKYKDLYNCEYILNTKRLNMIDADTFNNCCVLLEESRKTKLANIDVYIIVKRVIKSSCTCIEDVFYSYTNMNRTLLDLIFELYSSMDTFTMYSILDRSYIEIIDEFKINGGIT